MKKKSLFVLIGLVSLLLLFAGCSPNQTKTEENETKKAMGTGADQESYATYPFTKGTTIAEPTADISKFVGTYIYAPYGSSAYSGYEYVSFLSNGTVVAFDYAPTAWTSASEVRKGTWSLSDGKLTASFGDVSYTNSEIGYVEESKVFRIKSISAGSYSFYDVFLKQSDSTVDAGIYTDTSKIVGLWGRTDDYGNVSGYRFTSDGYVYYYGYTGTVAKRTYQMSNKKTEIRMTSLTLPNDYEDSSIFLCGDYLYLGVLEYKKMD